MLREFKGYKRGVDFGGWLSQCNYTKERYDNFITEDDFKVVAGWGADHIRVPVDYNLVENEAGDYLEEGFAYIDKAVEYAGKYGLNMILDLHKTYGFSFYAGARESGFFEKEEYQERFYRLWEEFAKRYGQYESRLVFELLNEVTDASYKDTWNHIAGTCIERIRQIAPTIRILVGGYWNNSAAAVKDLLLPPDENIVYNFHCYDPLIFTHQGAPWIPEMPVDFRYEFDHTYKEYCDLIEKYCPYWKSEVLEKGDPDEKIDSEYFIKSFEEAVTVSEERNVPLYCGEYGVIDRANPKDEIKWLTAIHGAFEYYGIGRAIWNYKEMDFGLTRDNLAQYTDVINNLL